MHRLLSHPPPLDRSVSSMDAHGLLKAKHGARASSLVCPGSPAGHSTLEGATRHADRSALESGLPASGRASQTMASSDGRDRWAAGELQLLLPGDQAVWTPHEVT